MNCKLCNKEFKRRCKTHVFCSRHCQSKWLKQNNISGRKKSGAWNFCATCGKSYYVRPCEISRTKYCSRICLGKSHLIQYQNRFKKEGRPPKRYKQITIDGKQVREHRYVMEQYLGRKLSPKEHVHHIDGNGLNNMLENLILLSHSDHSKLEIKLKS